MKKTITAALAGLWALVSPLALATPANAAHGPANDILDLIMQNDAYFFGSIGAGVLTLAMTIYAVAGMGRRRRRLAIAAYDDELTRYRQELRRGRA